MNKSNLLVLLAISVIAGMAFTGCNKSEKTSHDHSSHAAHDDHEGHNHSSHADHDDHEGHDHSAHSDHDDHEGHDHSDHDEAPSVAVSERGKSLAGITIDTVKSISIGKKIVLTGEIGINEDNLAHVQPRYAGVATKVYGRLGQYVKSGTLLAEVESNTSFSSYKIKAPISGRIIGKHITPGEYVGEEKDLFVIANLATVWVNCLVYPKDMSSVKVGQKVLISSIDTDISTETTISYINPIIDGSTRSTTARAILSTPNGTWRPGMYIKGTIELASPEAVTAVTRNAVQFLDNKEVVFIPDGKGTFSPVEIKTGLRDDRYIEIASNLSIGDKYVSEGAFELKAHIVTSALGDHAGHGH